MPFIYTVSPHYGVSNKTNDQLLDFLEYLSQHGRNGTAPSVIRAAFAAAARRGLITSQEAEAGVKEVLRIPVKPVVSGGISA